MKKAAPKGKRRGPSKKAKAKRPARTSAALAKINQTQAKLLTDIPEETTPDKSPPIAAMKARKAAFVRAMTQSLGVAAKASVMTGIPLRTHRQWMQDDEMYRGLISELKEVALDFYEEALHDLIKKGNPAATIFALKTQGRRRGWIETVHNINQQYDDNNVTVFEVPDNGRQVTQIEEAKIVS